MDKDTKNSDIPQLSGYALSRQWFDFCRMSTGKVTTNHIALYFYLVELCNSLSWPEQFSVPRSHTMGIVRITNHSTYTKVFNDLITWGFIELISKSNNQFTATIIKLCYVQIVHGNDNCYVQIDNGTVHGTVCINKPETLKPLKEEEEGKNVFLEIQKYYNSFNTLPTCIKLSEQRKKHLNARITEHGIETVKAIIKQASASKFLTGQNERKFLTGQNERKWKADIDWIMNVNNFIKIMEGKYDGNIIQREHLPKLGRTQFGGGGRSGSKNLPSADEHEKDTLAGYLAERGKKYN